MTRPCGPSGVQVCTAIYGVDKKPARGVTRKGPEVTDNFQLDT